MKKGLKLALVQMRTGRAWSLSALVLLAATVTIQAGDFTYTLNADNATITITGYTGPAGEIVIPSTIDGMIVTGIGDRAFEYSETPTRVTIGNNVTNIGNYAFHQCGYLRDVIIGGSVTRIGDSAFYDCPYLARVTIGNGVTDIGNRVFNNCLYLTSITIGNSVIRIGDWAFWNCNRLECVTIPNSVTDIGGHAFASCTSLAIVTIGSGVTHIADEAFSGCLDLADVYFQGNVPSLGALVFYEVYNAAAYYLPGTTGWGPVFGGLPTVLWEAPPLSAPTGVSAGDETYNYKVPIAWTAVSGAAYYQVFRHTANDSAGAGQIGTTFSTSYDDNSADAGPIYYYWVKAVNAAGASSFSAPDSGRIDVSGTLITANGLVDDVYLNNGDTVTIAVEMNDMDAYFGSEVDWWGIAFAHSGEWYYLNNAIQWTPFNGDLESCQPAAQGPVGNLSATTVLDRYPLARGTYDFWFAIDYPKDGILDIYGRIMSDKVTVVVQ